jgi:hypothetical protein
MNQREQLVARRGSAKLVSARIIESSDEEAFWRQRFDGQAPEPWAWLFKARDLRRGATALHVRIERELERLSDTSRELTRARDVHLIGSCLLLAGFAIENLIKGVLVRNKPGLVGGSEAATNTSEPQPDQFV